MNDQAPPGGWPLRMAITSLVRAPMQTAARQFLQLEALSSTPPMALTQVRRLLWLDICERIQLRELTARGFEHGSPVAVTIAIEFFNSATPDYEADTLSSHGFVYYGVRMFLQAPGSNLEIPPQVAKSMPSRNGRVGPASEAPRMMKALDEMISAGVSFSSKTEAHAAVLKKLGISGAPRGYSYNTFFDHLDGRLSGPTG